MIPATHTYYPHVYRIKLTSPPTLTLSFLLLAPKRSTHAHIVDHPARRSGLVPCILLPHGLPRLALRRPVRRQPDNRHVEQLNLACTCAYRQAYVRKSGISGRGCVYEPETEEPRRCACRSISDSLSTLLRSRWLTVLRSCFALCFACRSIILVTNYVVVA